jgi:uncharacterized protein YbjT (DUF2867 family)
MRIAVFGATGVVGRALVPLLSKHNDVVAVSRHADGIRRRCLETATADVADARAVRRVLDGVDIAYYLVHSLGSPDFSERDRHGAANVAREAERAGVTQIVYLGGLGDDTPELSPHLKSRIETATALASGAVPVTTLRAAVVVGRGSAGFETIVALVNRLPVMIAPRWVSTETQPIALADIARYLEGVAGHEAAIGQSLDVGGPEVITYREMIETVARLQGKRRLIVEVPVLTPRLSSYWLHLVTPVRAGVAMPLVEGLRNPTVARNDDIRKLVSIDLTSFEDAARAALWS